MLFVAWAAVFVQAHVSPTEKRVKGLFFVSGILPNIGNSQYKPDVCSSDVPSFPSLLFPPTQYPPLLPCSLFHNLSGDQCLEMERSLLLLALWALASIPAFLLAGEFQTTAFQVP